MSAELPALSAVVARLPDPAIHLAAYGGIVFPLALIIESPIINLLSASTSWSKDWESYQKIFRFMMIASAALTSLHILVAFSPIYDFIARQVLHAPESIIEPARLGLKIMLPWTWSIAYRRLHQGVLIRYNHSQAIGVGTVIRLLSDLTILTLASLAHLPGIVVATSAVASGVIIEAVYVSWVVRPVLRKELKFSEPVSPRFTYYNFFAFYIPLIMTALLSLIVQPIGSAGIGRMPMALESLAVWPVVTGLIFMLRSMGMALNEVVVALLDEPGSYLALRRFTGILATVVSLLLGIIVITPLASVWFHQVAGLDPEFSQMAVNALWFALPLPAMSCLQSWYQGTIIQSRQTRSITESMAIYLGICLVLIVVGTAYGKIPGIYIGMSIFMVATLIQTTWLWYRSRPAMRRVQDRDQDQLDRAMVDALEEA
jgi:hypothetical protein